MGDTFGKGVDTIKAPCWVFSFQTCYLGFDLLCKSSELFHNGFHNRTGMTWVWELCSCHLDVWVLCKSGVFISEAMLDCVYVFNHVIKNAHKIHLKSKPFNFMLRIMQGVQCNTIIIKQQQNNILFEITALDSRELVRSQSSESPLNVILIWRIWLDGQRGLIFLLNSRVYTENRNSIMNNTCKYKLTSHLDKMSVVLFMNVSIVFFPFRNMLYHKTVAVETIRISKKLWRVNVGSNSKNFSNPFFFSCPAPTKLLKFLILFLEKKKWFFVFF